MAPLPLNMSHQCSEEENKPCLMYENSMWHMQIQGTRSGIKLKTFDINLSLSLPENTRVDTYLLDVSRQCFIITDSMCVRGTWSNATPLKSAALHNAAIWFLNPWFHGVIIFCMCVVLCFEHGIHYFQRNAVKLQTEHRLQTAVNLCCLSRWASVVMHRPAFCSWL